MPIFLSTILVVLILLSTYWLTKPHASSPEKDLWDPGFDAESFITTGDRSFYGQYSQAPMVYDLSKNTMTQTVDIVFEKQAIFGEDQPVIVEKYDTRQALYNWVIQGAQVTPSIESLAARITRDAGDDRVEQAKAIFHFVSNYLQYSLDGAYEFPVTALLEREGQCSEFATLLTSLYRAKDFETNYIFTSTDATDYFEMWHIWIAVYIPEFEPTDPGQDIVTSKLGKGWLGLDTTGNQCSFGELHGIFDLHSNIRSIVEPITALTIYEVVAGWDSLDAEENRCVHLDLYLKTWEQEREGPINLTFKLYENDIITDEMSFQFDEFEDVNLVLDLTYNSMAWEGRGEQYITISVT